MTLAGSPGSPGSRGTYPEISVMPTRTSRRPQASSPSWSPSID
jgi:hypothetical protein